MIPQAFEVAYGYSLTVLCKDEGAARQRARDLHGTAVDPLYKLTQAQLDWLAKMPAEGAPCATPLPPL